MKYEKTIIDHNIRRKFFLTIEQYVFLDCIYQFNCKKKYDINSGDFETAIGFFTREEAKNCFLSLKGTELLQINGTRIKTTQLWNGNFINEDLLPQIMVHLNETLGTNYNASNAETKKHINARLKDGYTLHDFILVIESRCAEWSEDAHMRQYLRPATLFGNKFESYLQHAIANATKPIVKKETEKNGTRKPTNFDHLAGAYRDIPD